MWLLSWKKYKLSKSATFISVIGALMRYAAVLCIANGLVPGFLVCAAIGVGLHFWAESVSNKKWQKMVVEKGFANKIAAGDAETAVSVYNASPSEATLKFIASYNPQMAAVVRARIKK